jgi:lysophospholipid acyltransferase (LPLAT)-like uncharacterized protein
MGQLKQRWRAIRPEILSGIIYFFVNVTGRTLRIRTVNFPQDDSQTIFCGWHGRSLVFAYYFRRRDYWVIISTSRDGDMQNAIFKMFGFKTIRGSTGRGGARAAIESIRVLRDGGTMAITPDGPRGPSGIVQGGAMTIAQKSGAKLVPVGISARPRYLVKSWDRYLVPYIFGRGILIFGEPLTVPRDATEDEVELVRLKLESECHRLQDEADKELGIKL